MATNAPDLVRLRCSHDAPLTAECCGAAQVEIWVAKGREADAAATPYGVTGRLVVTCEG